MDETTDSGRIEQATVVFRYVDFDGVIHENFFGFVEAESTTGRGLADLLTKFVEDAGLSLNNCRGQGYDGAAAMSGHLNGCQAFIKVKQPLAVYTH